MKAKIKKMAHQVIRKLRIQIDDKVKYERISSTCYCEINKNHLDRKVREEDIKKGATEDDDSF